MELEVSLANEENFSDPPEDKEEIIDAIFPEDKEDAISLKDNVGSKPFLPSQKEYDEQVKENERQRLEKLQNQTHGNKCKECMKFMITTPNPKSNYGMCKWNGMMVLKFSACCDKFRKNNKPKSAWDVE